MSEHKRRKTTADTGHGKTPFGRQVDSMQSMLKRVEMYGNKLNAQILNIKRLLRTNQNVVAQLKANEQTLKSLMGEKKKLKPKPVRARQRSSKQLVEVLTKFNSVAQELERLRPPSSSPRREACKVASIKEICSVQCKPTTEGCLPRMEVETVGCATELQSERAALFKALKRDLADRPRGGGRDPAETLTTGLRNVQLQRHHTLIGRVEKILESVENLDMKTEIVSDVKILCNLVRNALIQRKKRLLQSDCQQSRRSEKLRQENRVTFSKLCQTGHINPYM
ncbi:uncharacterized protein LOC117898042 [Drosophila subobscura]|uniref:uncharacterized protein LOC117898042 n=1 Tax=Drosophila subobscura TaxID=7241 RepID=UPI00155A1E88|nr:uncharacterized protein LOC117898042 [Drosophila subobscura]